MSHPTSQDEPLLSPLWLVRGFPVVITLLVATAFFFHDDTARSVCLGGALGLLIGLTVYSFSIKGVVLKNTAQPSDVKSYPLT
jgi:hypothetical protein